MTSPIRTFGDVLPSTIDALARGGIAASQAKLAPADRLFHRELLRLFLHGGQPPSSTDLRLLAARLGVAPEDAMATLAEADLAHLDQETNTIAVAYPLSGRPSPHRVIMSDGTTLTAMCAVDALGIPLMTRRSATIESVDPVTGDEIRVRWEQGTWTWQPTTAVVVLAAAGCDGPIADACNHTAFHLNAEFAQEFLSRRPDYTGRVLSQREATDVAEQEFGPLLGVGTSHETKPRA
ncbi:organomercurial lyase [Actinophytocola sp.]|uniref:organomercurial lyase n=1 Tax=Actinophytocola sp. TaxID=1872138 RepID=UPI003D6A055A